MKAIAFVLMAVLLFSGCALFMSKTPVLVPLEDDPSIVFPSFTDRAPISVGAGDDLHELDGALLGALMIATRDFLPPPSEDIPCSGKMESQSYRVITRGDVFFISISENPVRCGHEYPALDSGARYAISRDGKILRRRLDGQSEFPRAPPGEDDAGWIEAAPGAVSPVESSSPALDGGSTPLPEMDGGSAQGARPD